MPIKNAAVTVSVVCWDTANNAGKTGDASNITLRGVRDGTLFTPSAPSITEMDATNLPGVYKASLTAGENDGVFLSLGGKSSTTNCIIIPVSWANELTGDAFARLGAPSGASVSADIAAVKSDTGATLADTNELQTDLANGGRLDLLIDAVKAKTDGLPASPAAVGSAMTLTSAYDAAKTAASQASVNTIDNIVDAILEDTGTTLNGKVDTIASDAVIIKGTANDIAADTLKLSTAMELDGAVYRFTANALEQGPTGGSAGTLVSDIATAVWAAGARTLTTISDSSGVTTLLSRIGSALTISSGKVTVGTNDDKTGYALSAAGLAAIWDRLTSALTTAGSIGKRLADYFAGSSGTAPTLDATALQICNNALLMLGNITITSLDDTGKAAVLCNHFYQQVIDATLRAYKWNCATVRDTLTADETAPEFGFAYRYAVPDDCLRVLGMSEDKTRFKVENGYILTDDSEGMVSYIKRIDAADMDKLLIDAASARMAATLAFPLTNSQSVAEAMWKFYLERLDEARTVDASEGSSEQMLNDDWLNARR